MTIGEAIKDAREKHGWSQAKLADMMGVSDKTVSAWENDRNIPPLGVANKLVWIAGVESSVFADYGLDTIGDLQERINAAAFKGRKAAEAEARVAVKTTVTVPKRRHAVRVEGDTIHVELEPITSYQLTTQEARLIAYYRIMSQAQQESFVSMAKSMVEK